MQRYGIYGATASISLLLISKPYQENAAEQQAFVKFTLRKPVDFAIISATSALAMEKGRCTSACILLGALGPGPVGAAATETVLIGKPVTRETAVAEAKPSSKII